MRIFVTTDDIHRGTRGHALVCPVSLAISRAIQHSREVKVETQSVRLAKAQVVAGKLKPVRLALDPRVSFVIGHYDRSGYMRPFEFELDIPDLPPASGVYE